MRLILIDQNKEEILNTINGSVFLLYLLQYKCSELSPLGTNSPVTDIFQRRVATYEFSILSIHIHICSKGVYVSNFGSLYFFVL